MSTDPTGKPAKTVLIWEDASDEQAQWWVSRVQHLGQELVVAEDPFTNSYLLLVRTGGRSELSVVSAFQEADPGATIAAAKAAAIRWLDHEDTSDLRWQKWRWQIARAARMSMYDLPLILLSALFGIATGWFVGVFFDTTGQRGLWTVLFGLGIGGVLGPILSHFIRNGFGSKRSSTFRAVMVTVCAGLCGALTVALMVLPAA